MGLVRTPAVVIGRRGLGESDRLVTLYSRAFGKIRGVARAARRPRSRFGSALELFTLGELVGFDTGRSDLLRIDHFDIVHPFRRLREDLERFGQASWVVECVGRLTADHDRHPGLWSLLVRGLRAVEGAGRPGRAAVCFGVRLIDTLGHGPRLDACVECRRRYPFPARFDPDAGGLRCPACGSGTAGARPVSPAAVSALVRLRQARWDAALTMALDRVEPELAALVDLQVAWLAGQPTRTPRFLRALARLSSGGRP